MGIACKVFIKGNEPVYILEQVNRFVVEDAKEEKKSRETIVNNILADYYDYISCIDDEK
jgi:phosphoribulokinase